MSRLRKRGFAVSAGVALVLVPTLFSVFTEWTRWPVEIRVAVIFLWVLVAGLVVMSSAVQSEQIDELLGQPLRRRELAREVALPRLIHALLAHSLPTTYDFTLYMPNPRRDRLLPEFSSTGDPDEGWEIGTSVAHGITGAAWHTNSYVAAKGAHVSDATYGLSTEEQARYAHLTGVAAYPVQNARRQGIGVLTIATSDPDPPVFAKEFVETVIGTAEIAARILIDVGGVARD